MPRVRANIFALVLTGVVTVVTLASTALPVRAQSTWADRLGYPPESRVVVIHATNVGTIYDANEAAEAHLEEGVATGALPGKLIRGAQDASSAPG